MKKKGKRILFIVQYPEHIAPGQRYRIEQYQSLLQSNGYTFSTSPFLSSEGFQLIHSTRPAARKIAAVLAGFAKRFAGLFSICNYDYIFIQREASPVGPAIFEWIYAKAFKKKLIYDFDDAIWLPVISANNQLALAAKNTGKVKNICRWVYKVSCGNEFLCSYARQYNKNVVYNPTCVDTENHHNLVALQDVAIVTIGWTGSFSTLMYLDIVQPALKKLQEKYTFNVKIICNKKPMLDLQNVQYVPWTEENEVTELATCQIGLMPLTQDALAEGKCGFKLIQYLALAIPSVSSPVGVNKSIIEEGINGFLCATNEQWYATLEKLITDAQLRKQLGSNGRKKIVEEYSVQANAKNFLALFK